MAIQTSDIIQITDVQSFLGQLILNVYHYRVVSFDEGTDYSDFAQQFELLVAGVVADVQSASVNHNMVIVKNLTNGIDIWEEPADIDGATTGGDDLPSFVALSFRLVRSSGLTRHGAKRIGGLDEGTIAGNGISSSFADEVAAIEAALGSPLMREGTMADFVLQPVIVGRFPEGHANAGQFDLSKVNDVSAAQFIRVSSQTTRRAGRGA